MNAILLFLLLVSAAGFFKQVARQDAQLAPCWRSFLTIGRCTMSQSLMRANKDNYSGQQAEYQEKHPNYFTSRQEIWVILISSLWFLTQLCDFFFMECWNSSCSRCTVKLNVPVSLGGIGSLPVGRRRQNAFHFFSLASNSGFSGTNLHILWVCHSF